MTVRQDPATVAGPEPARSDYADGVSGPKEQRALPAGGNNVTATVAPGTVRTAENIVLGIVALITVATLLGLYLLLMALR